MLLAISWHHYLLDAFFAEGEDWALALTTIPELGSAWIVTPSSHSEEVGVESAASVLALVAVLKNLSQNLVKTIVRIQLIRGTTGLRSRCSVVMSCSRAAADSR